MPDKEGKDSIRVILDSRLETPLDAQIINQESDNKTIIVTGDHVKKEKMELFSSKDQVEILSLTLNTEGRIPLRSLLKILHDRGISSILIEGGARINYSFLQENLLDKVYAFTAPAIIGGNDGISVFTGKGPERMNEIKRLRDIEYQILDDNILLVGKF